jgi:DNA-binding transcriptional MerR regulator
LSQLVSKTSNESSGLWLPIIEYSVKTGVSLSTIRRKIKSNSIQFRLDKGRYLILYSGMKDHLETPAPPPPIPTDIHRWQDQPLSSLNPSNLNAKFREISSAGFVTETAPVSTSPDTEKMVEKAVTMVSDAFEHAITEKEARIRLLEKSNKQLEERVQELKLLVKVLEDKFKVRY